MNSKQYKQLLNECYRSFRLIDLLEGDENDFFEQLDDLRKINKKYCDETEYKLYYPNHNMETARLLGEDLKRLCSEVNITIKFIPLTRERLKDNTYTKFYYQNIDITKIIKI